MGKTNEYLFGRHDIMKKISIGNICRGLALIILGLLVLHIPAGCSSIRKNQNIPDEGEKIVYSDTRYRMVQGQAIHKPSPVKGREYVFIPLTLHNGSGMGIIFSTRVCIEAYALPSGENCPIPATPLHTAGNTSRTSSSLTVSFIPVGKPSAGLPLTCRKAPDRYTSTSPRASMKGNVCHLTAKYE